uniref:Trimeric intracellular cation channel type B-like n=1 Tax=Sinocyclocheilus rhinocerous TaxID=307959 RepID=A0A673KFJ2_9TELE
MDVFGFLNLNELALGLSNLSMFPCFDMAHYIISVMSLREQPGALEVSQRSPFACWFSSMLYCFGGAVLSALMMADAPVAPLSNTTNLLLASLILECIDMCVCVCVVTRTWKVLGGVTQAGRKYKDGLFVMIAVGWAKGAGGGLLSNFEQLVRGVWKPETNELLKMSYPTKVTLLGSVLFSLHQCRFLPIHTHQLIFIYTLFIVTNKVYIMSDNKPFSAVETLLYKTLFVRPLTFSPLTDSSPIRNKPNGSASDEPDQTNPKDAENTKKTD